MHDERDLVIHAETAALAATLLRPAGARGLVVIALDSTRSRRHPARSRLARAVADQGSAALLVDVLTPREAIDRRNDRDLDLLRRRLAAIADWLLTDPTIDANPLGLLAAGLPGLAALQVAAERSDTIAAVAALNPRPEPTRPLLERLGPRAIVLAEPDTVGPHATPVAAADRLGAWFTRCFHQTSLRSA